MTCKGSLLQLLVCNFRLVEKNVFEIRYKARLIRQVNFDYRKASKRRSSFFPEMLLLLLLGTDTDKQ